MRKLNIEHGYHIRMSQLCWAGSSLRCCRAAGQVLALVSDPLRTCDKAALWKDEEELSFFCG